MMIRRYLGQTFLCGALIAVSAVWTVQAAPAQDKEQKPTEAERKTISIDDEVLTIYGKEIKLPSKREDFVKVLGPPSRETKAGENGKPPDNTLLTWDDQGIMIFVRPREDYVNAVLIALETKTTDFRPRNVFAGKLLVDGVEIKTDSDIAKVNTAKKGKPFVQHQSFKEWWMLKHTDIAVYLEKRDERGISSVSVNVRVK